MAFGFALSAPLAHADEWSVVPTGDPIYRQLGIIDQFGDGKTTKVSKGLTRYEAALQVARTITFSGTESSALPRTGWRALSDLTQALRPELTQLGIDVNATLATCAKNLAASGPKSSGVDTTGSTASGMAATSGGPLGFRSQGRALLGTTGMRAPLLGSAGTAQQDAVLGLSSSSFQMALSQHLRMDVASLMYMPASTDPLATSYAARNVGNGISLAYDLGSRLQLRAGTTQRDLLGDPSQAPLFTSALFQGARQARGTGGGLDANLGSFSIFGDVERLSTDTGESGTLMGGGARLSAWQNRLVASARLSVLRPEERSALISTGTELGLGVGLSQRLRLNLLYQSLFTQQSVNNASRVSGGLSLSF